MVHFVTDVFARNVGLPMDFVLVALLKSKIHSRFQTFKTISVTLLRIPLNKNRAISIIHHFKMHRMFLVSIVEVLTLARIVKQGIHFLVTIMTIRIMTNLHSTK